MIVPVPEVLIKTGLVSVAVARSSLKAKQDLSERDKRFEDGSNSQGRPQSLKDLRVTSKGHSAVDDDVAPQDESLEEVDLRDFSDFDVDAQVLEESGLGSVPDKDGDV